MVLSKRKVKRAARQYWPLAIGAFLVLILLVTWLALPADAWIKSVGAKVSELGWAAPLIYIGCYFIWHRRTRPVAPDEHRRGSRGWWGFPLAVIGATAGATASFLISRHFLNDDHEEWLSDRRIFSAIKRVMDEGWKIRILLRLSPIVPFGLLNYLLGLTKTPLLTYVCSTIVGILPGSFVDIYIGVIGQNLAGGRQIAYLAAGALVTIAGAAIVTLKARSSLREAGVKT